MSFVFLCIFARHFISNMKKIVFHLSLCLFLFACNIINKDEPLPIYISVPQPHVLVDKQTGYESDLGVKVVWLEAGIDSFGYFATPKTFPVFPGTSKDYYIYGGINDLGQGFVAQYPFWKPIQQRISVNELDTFKFSNLRFEYFNDTILAYPFIEQFENASVLLKRTSSSELDIQFNPTDKHERSYSGLLQFNNLQKVADFETDGGWIYLPVNQPSYLEVTYKSDITFQMGLKYNSSGLVGDAPLAATVNASPDKWTTVYFRLNNVMAAMDASLSPGATYKAFFRANAGGENKKILLDNIRIIYRK